MLAMLTSILSFDTNAVASVMTYTGTLFSDLQYIIVLVIGIPLGFWIIRKVIGLVRAR
jgi:hypothetical protein